MRKNHRRQEPTASRLTLSDPKKLAKATHLRYVLDDSPGFTRKRNRNGFRYFDTQGRRIRQIERLRRFKALAIPPAWEDVWISPWADSHLQATGRDARGRKQHRYHPRRPNAKDSANRDSTSTLSGRRLSTILVPSLLLAPKPLPGYKETI